MNTCRHRGNAVCRADEGHSSSFMCTYHGWTYDLKGDLVGVPGFKEVYHEELDRENWGLIKAAKVDTFKGFIFATMDGEAPELDEFLGEVGRLGLNQLAMHGDNKAVGGIVKYTIPCNWKFATDNIWDFYHGITTHASAYISTVPAGAPIRNSKGRYVARNLVLPRRVRPHHERARPDAGTPARATRAPQPVRASSRPGATSRRTRKSSAAWASRPAGTRSIFPNMWLTGNQVVMRLPKGPHKTEHWFFTLLNAELPEETLKRAAPQRQARLRPGRLLGAGRRRELGREHEGHARRDEPQVPPQLRDERRQGRVIEEEDAPPYIESRIAEHAQLWYYRNWTEWMAAESWRRGPDEPTSDRRQGLGQLPNAGGANMTLETIRPNDMLSMVDLEKGPSTGASSTTRTSTSSRWSRSSPAPGSSCATSRRSPTRATSS